MKGNRGAEISLKNVSDQDRSSLVVNVALLQGNAVLLRVVLDLVPAVESEGVDHPHGVEVGALEHEAVVLLVHLAAALDVLELLVDRALVALVQACNASVIPVCYSFLFSF